ncbi:sensor histidine kinase [Celeribacter indicus]|uniref:histidine kinase n=1 Tax=Celeribacter indicus TaxID=1208324 RepID=A0A0B5DX51_9RHOB|nr:sensor histidine kinase [Celeribacter indicus]AJE45331.1 sensor histidine kinase ChvG [Celeribacter indicus]SDX19771.1 two-component system, OmpR family, sensor histidine kinase ChvG [Celeribacter indicus]
MVFSPRMDRPAKRRRENADVVLGDDWIAPRTSDADLRARREGRRFIAINRSPLAQKIVTFNLVAIILMVAGILYLNPFRDSLVTQREMAMVTEAALIADMIEVYAGEDGVPGGMASAEGARRIAEVIAIPLREHVYVYDREGALIASTEGLPRVRPTNVAGLQDERRTTVISDFLNNIWSAITPARSAENAVIAEDAARVAPLVARTLGNEINVDTSVDAHGLTVFTVAAPITREVDGRVETLGVVGLVSGEGEIDELVRVEREQILQVFVIAFLVSIGLSLVLASTIANPLADLAAAAEIGRDKNSRKLAPGRVRIPDLSGRPDEIGRLSSALRGMVSALYDRIDANEQFAADVAHEIKNPLASLRSAVGSLRMIRKEEHREKLLDVIEHDVRRLDRLVSDISNASRLDSELVKEDEEEFDLLTMLGNLIDYLSQEAQRNGVEFISDLPDTPIVISGLEARLAQVFVNLITNAISFCEEGDAIRVWVRKRDSRVLVVVEDTGPGIPDQALSKIFRRFYSERPAGQFGNNSGLGLAISKQIVEAHGGVIWAENIRPTDADITSEPLGARFVVGLPV